MDLTRLYIVCYAIVLVIAGYLVPFIGKKTLARSLAWMIAVITVWASALFTAGQPPLLRMITIVFLQLLSMKAVVAAETSSGHNRLKMFQWIAFSLGWFGMRPALFEKLPATSLPCLNLVLKAISRIAVGWLLLYLSTIAEQYAHAVRYYIPQVLLLAGLSLILHFGILNLSAAAWRFMGVDAPELFRAPYRSASLKEFWGRRWNLAFSEMTALIAYRPLKGKMGGQKALAVSFLLSGLLHEIAISLPAGSGYGLPMLYFAIHAAAMQLEAKLPVVQKIIAHRMLSRLWVMGFLVLPMPLLFHPQFMLNVLVPLRSILLKALGLV